MKDIYTQDGAVSVEGVGRGGETLWSVRNTGSEAVCLRDVAVARYPFDYGEETPLYGEGYQMLTQNVGTIGAFETITAYSDEEHYRLRQVEGYKTVYNYMLAKPDEKYDMFAFSSCRRFNGRILLGGGEIIMVLDLEGICVEPGETVELEYTLVCRGETRAALLDKLASALASHHRVRSVPELPTGWCSWYCFGPSVTAKNVEDNLTVMRRRLPHLTFVQIDDGYQRRVGDWLESAESYGDVRQTIDAIRHSGAEPAIWVAPFVAERDSKLFRDHPDYFIQGDDGTPLSSGDFTFEGWRNEPWYMLDGTNPGACEYLRHVFATMRREWGVKYFKLDANVWGAFPNGHRYAANSTCVDAYRGGMDAIWQGAGEDAIILGCNAPMWPSVGAVNAMRVSGDMVRGVKTIRTLRREIFRRNWMHRRLWTNDPDVVTVRAGNLTAANLEYQRTEIFASAGMLLVGDDMTKYTDADFALIDRFDTVFDSAAVFGEEDEDLTHAVLRQDGREYHAYFNDGDEPVEVDLPADRSAHDHWTDLPVTSPVRIEPHGARLIRL